MNRAIIPHVKETEFAREVLQSAEPVEVDVGAAWCAPCRQLTPTLSAACAEKGVRVVAVDADSAPELVASLGVAALPTLLGFSGGEVIARFRGAAPRKKLLGWLTQFQEDAVR